VCKRLWTEETVTHHGEFFLFDEAVFEPKPLQKPWPPILVGGESKAALRRAARLGDGWIGMAHTFETAAEQVASLRKYLREHDRDDATFPDRAGRPRELARRHRAMGGARCDAQ
jgi:alkanesulfonate monooxygenase SsuD/methylene tetrahydromethanopterin reductase-like flavin-dependent oxidoreductase (luciferase family)